jgi:hypothetical protein
MIALKIISKERVSTAASEIGLGSAFSTMQNLPIQGVRDSK